MRLDKFTLRAQEAIQSAIELAERNQHQQVEPEHLLVAMFEQPEGIVRPLSASSARTSRSFLTTRRRLSHVFRAFRGANSISVLG